MKKTTEQLNKELFCHTFPFKIVDPNGKVKYFETRANMEWYFETQIKPKYK